MITLDEWAEIRRLHRSEGLGIKAVAAEAGDLEEHGAACAAGRGGAAVSASAERVDRRCGRAGDPEQLALCATMPATVIAERIGWGRSITVLRERVAELRPLYLPQDPTGRTSYEPGERVQDDFWFPPVELPLGHGTVAAGNRCRRCW